MLTPIEFESVSRLGAYRTPDVIETFLWLVTFSLTAANCVADRVRLHPAADGQPESSLVRQIRRAVLDYTSGEAA